MDTDRGSGVSSWLLRWREELLFWPLALFLLGYYWLPSTRELWSTPHDLLFYLGFMPLLLLIWPAAVWRALRQSRLMALALCFVAYLGASALWPQTDTELSRAQVLLQTAATAVFLVGCFVLLQGDRWRRIRALLAVAAVTIAMVSMVGYALGHRYPPGRLHSLIHFEHPNLFGHYLGFACLLCLLPLLGRRDRDSGRARWWAVAVVVLLVALVLTEGRTVFLALVAAAGTALLLARDRRAAARIAVLLMAVLAAADLLSGPDLGELLARGDAGRAEIYLDLWQRSAGHRLFGVGLAAVDDVVFPVGSGHFPGGFLMPHPHSAFLATFYYGGVVGLALLLAVVGAALWRSVRIWRGTGDATGLVLLIFGTVCLLPDGHRLVSHPHLSSWLILWLPVAWVAATPVGGGRRAAAADDVDADPPADASTARVGRLLFVALALLFCVQRLFHFGPDIDSPHMWRQADTAQYIRAFAEDGIDLLHPSVCWMADHRVTILEFPLPEAVAAVAYGVFGAHHAVARGVFFAFFLGSAFFLYRLLDELFDRGLARLATLIYLVMPLSLFYSRAIHIDFSALFFVHGMAFFFVRGVLRESRSQMWLGSAFAAVAMVIKAPYVLPVAVPLVWLVARERRWRFITRCVPALLAPALVFGLWQWHVYRVNSAVPDWSFIPHYHKMVDNWGWYFGTTRQRLRLGNWLTLVDRSWREILGTTGLVPAACGLLLSWRRRYSFIAAWVLGAFLMVLAFFNLSVHHNYYLIPALAPAACTVALGVQWLAVSLSRRPGAVGLTLMVMLLAMAAEHTHQAERRYYGVLHGLIDAGEAIGGATEPGSLVVVSSGGLDCRSPHLLYHAGRYGWSIPAHDLTPELLSRLASLGATALAVVHPDPPSGGLAEWLGAPYQVMSVPSGATRVHLFVLPPAGTPLARRLSHMSRHHPRGVP